MSPSKFVNVVDIDCIIVSLTNDGESIFKVVYNLIDGHFIHAVLLKLERK